MKAFVSNQHITVSTVQARNDDKRVTSADSTTNETHVKNSVQVVTESLVLVLLCLQRTAHLDVFTVDLPANTTMYHSTTHLVNKDKNNTVISEWNVCRKTGSVKDNEVLMKIASQLTYLSPGLLVITYSRNPLTY